MRYNKTIVKLFVLFLLLIPTGLLLGCNALNNSTAPQEFPLSEHRDAINAGLSWLIENNQNEDGGYGVDFETGNPASAPAATLDAIMAIASAGDMADEPIKGGLAAPLSFLGNDVDGLKAFAEGTGGNAGKVVLALSAAGQDPRNFATTDWITILQEQYSETGQFNTPDAFNHSLAILALAAVEEQVPDAAVPWLKDQQAADGSWDDGFGTLQNADATAMSIMALAAAGVPSEDPELAQGLQFLADSQLSTGGWEYGPGFGENANSTALVIQALAATGNDFYTDGGSWGQDGNSPYTVLLSWQNSTGAFQADFGQGPFDDFFSTVQSIPAVTGQPLPLPSGDSD